MTDDMTRDIIREVVNIGIGEAASALSVLIKSRVSIKIPDIYILDSHAASAFIRKEIQTLGVYISQGFYGGISGKTLLFYTRESSNSLVRNILGNESVTSALTDTAVASLQEIGNILMVSCVSTISNLIEDRFSFDIPDVTIELSEGYFQNLVQDLGKLDKTIFVRNQMVVRDKAIEGYIFLLLGFSDFLVIVEKMQNKLNRS